MNKAIRGWGRTRMKQMMICMMDLGVLTISLWTNIICMKLRILGIISDLPGIKYHIVHVHVNYCSLPYLYLLCVHLCYLFIIYM